MSEGKWAYADGHLLLEDEDGDQLQFEIEFTDGDVVANGNLWERH